MNFNQYNAKLHELTDRNLANLSELARWGVSEALPFLWQELAGIIGKRIAPLRPYDAIRFGLKTTLTERLKRPKEPNFYVAHLTMLDEEARLYCSAATDFLSNPIRSTGDATLFNLHDGLLELFRYAHFLFEQAAHLLLDLPGAYGGWARGVELPIEVLYGAQQVNYGQFSGLAFATRQPFASIPLLRTAIEIRLRSAFGVYGYLDPSNQSIKPIDLSRLEEEIKKRLSAIQFDVDFYDVMKIYRWSNPYLHAGRRDFVWASGYALRFLKPLFFRVGAASDGSWSLHGSIRMPRETWRAIREAFEKAAPKRRAWPCGWLWRRGSTLILNPADENNAACTFLT